MQNLFKIFVIFLMLKVLSYWNLNYRKVEVILKNYKLKVLSYWNLNVSVEFLENIEKDLKYYHIGI